MLLLHCSFTECDTVVALKYGACVQKGSEAANLGRKWQESILDICDQHFFFTQVCIAAFLHSAFVRLCSKELCSTLMLAEKRSWLLQIENFDQTTSTALQQWDDHEDLINYDFNTDSIQAPDNDDDKRKLAYRY